MDDINNPGIFKGGYDGLKFQTKYGIIEHQCILDTLQLFEDLLKDVKNGTFVEIGVLGGITLLHTYDICEKNAIRVYGIDPFENIELYNGLNGSQLPDPSIPEEVREKQLSNRTTLEGIIRDHKLKIDLIIGTSWENHERFEEGSIDLLHIDGDHSYDGVRKDIDLFWPKMKKGGTVVFDDYNWPSVSKAVDDFVRENGIPVESCRQFVYKFILTKN